jgi:hypothetical protein
MYNPSDFAHLDVSSEIKDLFQYIQRYKPQKIDLETRLKPFIPGNLPAPSLSTPVPNSFVSPDFIPAVGDIDPFIKIPRPDGKDGASAHVTIVLAQLTRAPQTLWALLCSTSPPPTKQTPQVFFDLYL